MIFQSNQSIHYTPFYRGLKSTTYDTSNLVVGSRTDLQYLSYRTWYSTFPSWVLTDRMRWVSMTRITESKDLTQINEPSLWVTWVLMTHYPSPDLWLTCFLPLVCWTHCIVILTHNPIWKENEIWLGMCSCFSLHHKLCIHCLFSF